MKMKLEILQSQEFHNLPKFTEQWKSQHADLSLNVLWHKPDDDKQFAKHTTVYKIDNQEEPSIAQGSRPNII